MYRYCKNTITNIYNYKPKHLYLYKEYQNLHMYPAVQTRLGVWHHGTFLSPIIYIKKKPENERFVFTEPDTNTQWSLEDSKVLM